MSPQDIARYLAVAKARVVASTYPDDLVLAADTIVAVGDTLCGKPVDPSDAAHMLRRLSGSTHTVVTSVALVCQNKGMEVVDSQISSVQMRTLTGQEIDTYVASGDWCGKAGGYGIQDDDPFVTRLTGSHTNIIGLPMEIVLPMLTQAGIKRTH